MGDRDALILICWAGILMLVFFECFYRKVKTRVNRDVQPPMNSSAVESCESERVGNSRRFFSPFSLTCSKDFCISFGGDNDPPPSYEEAVSSSSRVTKFQFSSYDDQNIRESSIVTPPVSTRPPEIAAMVSNDGGNNTAGAISSCSAQHEGGDATNVIMMSTTTEGEGQDRCETPPPPFSATYST